jgi:hypothetical protein
MQALEASMHHDNNTRNQAVQYITENQKQPGYVIALANISANK